MLYLEVGGLTEIEVQMKMILNDELSLFHLDQKLD